MILKIRKDIDPILRMPTEEVVDFGHEFQFFVDNMIETMRKNNGVGLAAPQVGVSKKVFICEFEGDEDLHLSSFPLTVICNPKITYKSKENRKMVEGCLSFPGLELLITRPENIVIEGQDRYGKKIEIKADNLYARVLQHELDHLNSVLMIDRLEETKIIFIGTGTMGTKALDIMAKDPQYKIAFVITSEDKKIIGRKKNEKLNPIEEIAKKNKLTIYKTKKLREDVNLINKIKEAKPDLGIIADFGQIVSSEVFNIPTHGVLNIHPSLLPRHRGASPIQSTILSGDEFAGVTIIKINERMDAGDIVSQVKVGLSHAETAGILKDYLSEIGASLLLNSIPYYLAGDLTPEPQDENHATYSKMVTKDDGMLDETSDKYLVDRKIRAYSEWPKAYVLHNNKRIQLISAHFEENGDFVIDRVKPEGKNEMSYEEYLRGYRHEISFN